MTFSQLRLQHPRLEGIGARDDDAVTGIVGFADAALFERFGLPAGPEE